MYNSFLETELDIHLYFATAIILSNYVLLLEKLAQAPQPNPKAQEDNQISEK